MSVSLADLVSLAWPLVTLVGLAIFAVPLRRLVDAVGEKVRQSENGTVETKWGSFSWRARVETQLGELESIPPSRSEAEGSRELNARRIPVSAPSDLIDEFHDAVLSALLELRGDASGSDDVWLASFVDELLKENGLDTRLVGPLLALDDLWAISRRSSAHPSLDAHSFGSLPRAHAGHLRTGGHTP